MLCVLKVCNNKNTKNTNSNSCRELSTKPGGEVFVIMRAECIAEA